MKMTGLPMELMTTSPPALAQTKEGPVLKTMRRTGMKTEQQMRSRSGRTMGRTRMMAPAQRTKMGGRKQTGTMSRMRTAQSMKLRSWMPKAQSKTARSWIPRARSKRTQALKKIRTPAKSWILRRALKRSLVLGDTAPRRNWIPRMVLNLMLLGTHLSLQIGWRMPANRSKQHTSCVMLGRH